MSKAPSRTPIRLVLFDVFDTLCTPRIPIHEQYYEEAIKAGISTSSISPSSVRLGFKPAFKEISSKYPLYGKKTQPDPITPEEWWTRLIRSCMLHAGATERDLEQSMSRLAPRLLERFESSEGYRIFPDTIPCLEKLKRLGVKTSVVSNADPRILRTLESLGITPLLTYPPTLSWDVEVSKPNSAIFEHALKACDQDLGEGVLMIGDELQADYYGAVNTGLGGRLIRRIGEWSDGAVRAKQEDLGDVVVISSLDDIVQEVEKRNVTSQ